LYFNEDVIHQPIVQPIDNVNTRFLPTDPMLDVLRHADMKTYVKLCTSSKDMRKLCTNQLWRYKFNQNGITIKTDPNYFNEWVELYKQHLHDSQIYAKVDRYLYFIQQNKDAFFLGTLTTSAYFTINLQKPLTKNQLIIFIKSTGADYDKFHFFNDEKMDTPEYIKQITDFARNDNYKIDVYYRKIGRSNQYQVEIGKFLMTPFQFRDLLYLLFLNHYLDEKWLYI
jgi:hypothetical protein